MSSQAQFQQFGPFFDGGVFVTGAKLYACAAGTTTQKNVWYDQAMTTTAPFPMVANANGQIVGFFDGLYKIIIARASSTGPSDNVLEVWDNYNVSSDGTITATGSTEPRFISDRFADWINVKNYGAVGDGLTDDTAAIVAALAAGGDSCNIWLPQGTYKVVSTITIAQDRVHFHGDGPYATQILFAPSADDTCLALTKGASIINQGSLSDLTFWSTDSTHAKVAIDLVDSVGYRIENVVVGGTVQVGSSYLWSGGTGSTGLQIQGRDSAKIRNIFIQADQPLTIKVNPNHSISIDHFHFSDTTLLANGFPCVTIDDGVNLTNVTIDGYNAWLLGTHGLYWNDTTTVGVSSNLVLQGIRTEQGTDATGYSFYISHNTTLQNLHVMDCYPDNSRRGFYLRKIQATLIQTTLYAGTLEAFNFVADSSIQALTFQNCFFQQNSTAVLTNFMLYDSLGEMVTDKPIPDTASYVYDVGPYLPTQRRRLPIFLTADLPAAAAAEDGLIVIENAGAGDVNLVFYGRGERHRIDGGANV